MLYDKYIEFCNIKLDEFKEAEKNGEVASDKYTQKDCPYLIKAAEKVLTELNKRRDWYANDDEGVRFFEMLKKEKSTVDGEIAYIQFYICYDWGHPEEYEPDLQKEATSLFYGMLLSELPIYLSENLD